MEEFVSKYFGLVGKNLIKVLLLTISITMTSFIALKQVPSYYLKMKLEKMPQIMKLFDRFRTVFNSAVLCELFSVPSFPVIVHLQPKEKSLKILDRKNGSKLKDLRPIRSFQSQYKSSVMEH